METRHPATPCGAVPEQTLAERLLYAAAVLHLSGFMSDGERRKVHARMMKWKAATAHLPSPTAPPKKKRVIVIRCWYEPSASPTARRQGRQEQKKRQTG